MKRKVDLIPHKEKRRRKGHSRKLAKKVTPLMVVLVVIGVATAGLVYLLWSEMDVEISGDMELEGQTQEKILYDGVELDDQHFAVTTLDYSLLNFGESFTVTHTLESQCADDYTVDFDLSNMPLGAEPFYGFYFEVREFGTTNVLTSIDLLAGTTISFDYWYSLDELFAETATQFPFNLVFNLNTDLMVEVTYPDGGETFDEQTEIIITWDGSSNIDHVDISFENNLGDKVLIADNEVNDGAYSWLIPNVGETVSMKIEIVGYESLDELGESITDYSDDFFTVTNIP